MYDTSIELTVVKLPEGGYVVRNWVNRNDPDSQVFGASTIDEALAFLKQKLGPDERGSCLRCHGKQV